MMDQRKEELVKGKKIYFCCNSFTLTFIYRVRRQKDRLATTELQKAQNRLKFGTEAEDEISGSMGSTVGLGMMNRKESGKIRASVADPRNKCKKMTKMLFYSYI